MKHLKKVFQEVNDYSMSVINEVTQQELNDSHIKTGTAETNETPNKIPLIFPDSAKQGIKLITKIKQHIKKTLLENILAIVTYQSKMLSGKFHVNFICNFFLIQVIWFTM